MCQIISLLVFAAQNLYDTYGTLCNILHETDGSDKREVKKTDIFDENFFKRIFVKLTRFQPKVFNEEEKEAMRQKLIEGNRKQDRDVLRCPEKLIAGRTTFKIRNKIHAKIAALTARLAEKIDNAETINAYGTKDQKIADGDKVIMELDKAKKQGALIDQVSAFIKNGIPERSKILARECRIATDYCYSVRYIFRLIT